MDTTYVIGSFDGRYVSKSDVHTDLEVLRRSYYETNAWGSWKQDSIDLVIIAQTSLGDMILFEEIIEVLQGVSEPFLVGILKRNAKVAEVYHAILDVQGVSQKRYRSLKSKIDEILYYFWDPCGISKDKDWFASGRDEYESYILAVIALLEKGATKEEMRTHLVQVTKSNIGFSTVDGAYADLAEMLMTAYKQTR